MRDHAFAFGIEDPPRQRGPQMTIISWPACSGPGRVPVAALTVIFCRICRPSSSSTCHVERLGGQGQQRLRSSNRPSGPALPVVVLVPSSRQRPGRRRWRSCRGSIRRAPARTTCGARPDQASTPPLSCPGVRVAERTTPGRSAWNARNRRGQADPIEPFASDAGGVGRTMRSAPRPAI